MMFELSDDQRAIVDSFVKFRDKEVRPPVEKHRERIWPRDEWGSMFGRLMEFGLGRSKIPLAAGGSGLDAVTSGLLYEKLSYVSVDLAAAIALVDVVLGMLHTSRNDYLIERFSPGLLSGATIPSIAITEPGTGSDVGSLRTKAVREGDGYRISGEKTWISNATLSDICLPLVRLESGEFAMFLVERERGYQTREITKLGLNSWPTGQVIFDEVRVPASHMIGQPGSTLQSILRDFQQMRPNVALFAVGIAQAALDAAVAYARERVQWGKPIAGHQMVQSLIAEMATDLDASRLLAYRALSLVDRNQRSDAEGSMAKWFATEAAVRIASKAIQIHGAYGLSTEYPVEKLFRDARMLTIPEGTSEIQQLIIGRAILGVSAIS